MSTTPNTNTPANNARRHGPSAVVLAFFTSPLFMMFALGLALLAQGKHTADVFAFWSHRDTPEWLFYAFAAGVEIAVFIFVLHDRKLISYAFAVGAFATNVVYYAIGGANLLSAEIVPVFLLSLLLPGVIVGYSHTIAEKPAQDDAQDATQATRRPWWQRLVFWRKPVETPTEIATANTTTPTPIVKPSESGGHSEGAVVESAPEQPQDAPQAGKRTVPPETKAIILRSIDNGAKLTDVAAEFDVSPNTVRSWIARMQKNTNGAGVH